ncbi:hypothetical protein [Paenisporosarcina cavernae]|uniref:Uncharacterized protein n=1 Tax=Paenisporosarcina cavernae TaxID=2320858 RepID=A0A385YWY0_9BACL|nr:hypothetical protein [Paenisporosarcina cavernae]AYC30022.1 hypothetical protein D3873_09110 [Paenisporosarcina cavernae]
MNRYSEDYRNTSSKEMYEIEKEAYLVSQFSSTFVNKQGKSIRHAFVFVVNRGRGFGDYKAVRRQTTDGDEIKRIPRILKKKMAVEPSEELAKRLAHATYIESLYDSCFKNW